MPSLDLTRYPTDRIISRLYCSTWYGLPSDAVVANFATTASDGKVYQVEHYNLDMIISVGYRVKSRRGVEFRRWANDILKQYILNGCAINEKRLIALKKTVGIQTKMLACTLEVEEEDILKAVSLE